MFIFYLLTFFAALPIAAYLLSQKTSNKGIIFGYATLILSFCLIIFVSKFSLLGSANKQLLNSKIMDQIYIDSKISQQYLKEIEITLDQDEVKEWMIALISRSIELNKLNSAETLIGFSEKFFLSNNEKIVFYGLYAGLRDARFPKFKNVSFEILKDSELPCSISNGSINLFIKNAPDIPIAKQDFQNIEEIIITNSKSIIPGFDLASAHLNYASVEFEINVYCKENTDEFYLRNLIVLDQENLINAYKIDLNEWLKKSQEL